MTKFNGKGYDPNEPRPSNKERKRSLFCFALHIYLIMIVSIQDRCYTKDIEGTGGQVLQHNYRDKSEQTREI